MRCSLQVLVASLAVTISACQDGPSALPQVLPDMDSDGLPDALELAIGSDPSDSSLPFPNGSGDLDNASGPGVDAIPDGLEEHLINSGATEPITTRTDSDGDGIPDYLEIAYGLEPFDPSAPYAAGNTDVDDASGPSGDGIPDGLESFVAWIGGSAPIDGTTDTDGDGVPDVIELQSGSAPVNPQSPTALEVVDVDRDGIPDYFEAILEHDPDDSDVPVLSGGEDVNATNGPNTDLISDALEQVLVTGGASAPVNQGTDTDQDGVPDWIEVNLASDPFSMDHPVVAGGGDIIDPTGPPGDGVSDAMEATLISLGAAAPIAPSIDSDGDNIPDVIEIQTGSAILDAKSPAVGVHIDTDADGIPDYFEHLHSTDAYDANDPLENGGDDSDGEGISDGLEFLLTSLGTSSSISNATDSDSDGLPDYAEVELGTNPFDINIPSASGGDTDSDGVSDALEAYLAALGAVDPIDGSTDSDTDGAPDYLEIFAGGNPLNADSPVASGGSDNDTDGISDALESVLVTLGAAPDVGPSTDSDLDGAPDYFEATTGSNAFDVDDPVGSGGLDSDGDGLTDALENILALEGALPPVSNRSDSDADGVPDFYEVFSGTGAFNVDSPALAGGGDTDLDGLSDAIESSIAAAGATGTIDASTDTDIDGLPDYLEIWAVANLNDGTSPAPTGSIDSDNDGVVDSVEAAAVALGANQPIGASTDVDGDGIPFYYEILSNTAELNTDSPTVNGAGAADVNPTTGPNGDGISDALESLLIFQGPSTFILTATDSDADGLPDYLEVRTATEPFNADSPLASGGDDSDGDGLSDAFEAYLLDSGTTALDPDTETDSDDDGFSDFLEVANGTDPFDEQSTPAPGSAPTASAAQISGTPVTGETLSGTYVYTDLESNPEGSSSFRWLRNGSVIDSATSISYTTVAADSGTTLTFEVTPRSIVGVPDTGAPVSAQVVIVNAAPTASNLMVIDENAGTIDAGDRLTGSYDYTDADGDPEGESTYRWLIDGVPIPNAIGSSYILQGSDVFDAPSDSSITFEVIPVAESGTTTGSPADTTRNTSASSLFLSGLAAVADVNGNSTLDAGDQVVIPFNQRVQVTESATITDFVLPISGDMFGTSATYTAGPRSNEITITLGDEPNLRTRGAFVTTETSAGDASGLELNSSGMATGVESLAQQPASPTSHTDLVPGFSNSDQFGSDNTHAIGIYDLNHDSHLDLVSANNDGANRIYWGDGTGAFVDSGQTLGASDSRSVAAGDVDGDGYLDLVFANAGNQPNRIYLNNGMGVFSDSNQMLGSSDSTSVQIADLDNMNGLDLVVANASGDANAIYLNDGSGSFTAPSQLFDSSDTRSIELADLNGDFHLDLVTANADGQANRVYTNNGSGLFLDSMQSLGSGDSRSVAIGDVDGDGNLDLVFANNSSEANTLFTGNGDGTFDESNERIGTSSSSDVALWDVDGDGALDLLVANTGTAPDQFYLNDGSGLFIDSQQRLGTGPSQAISTADLDGDGDADLAVATPSTIVVYTNARTGTWGFPQLLAHQSFNYGHEQESSLADIDNDGDLDLAIAHWAGAETRIFENLGDGTFNSKTTLFSPSVNSIGVSFGDLDGDGYVDALERVWGNGQLSHLFLNDGSGNFELESSFVTPQNYIYSARFVDVNGDNILDAIFEAQRFTYIYLNNGNAELEILQELNLFSGGIIRDLDIGDFDGDQYIDLVVPNLSQGSIRVAFNDGTGQFDPSDTILVNPGSSPFDVAVGDLDGDGLADLYATGSGDDLVYLNLGGGIFSLYQTPNPNNGYKVELADIDADGDLDAVITGQSDVHSRIYLNDGLGHFMDSGITGIPSGNGLSVDDLNGDGVIDFVFPNRSAAGSTQVLLGS